MAQINYITITDNNVLIIPGHDFWLNSTIKEGVLFDANKDGLLDGITLQNGQFQTQFDESLSSEYLKLWSQTTKVLSAILKKNWHKNDYEIKTFIESPKTFNKKFFKGKSELIIGRNKIGEAIKIYLNYNQKEQFEILIQGSNTLQNLLLLD